jgi:glutaredoxin 2
LSHKGTTETQLATLAAIQEYNKSLPKARRAKDSLPEIATSNISATYIIKKDLKKGTSEQITKYH